jgi:KTSC domain
MAEMPTLSSSCLAWVEYDFDSGTMYLTFRNGRSYALRGVPEYHYHGLLNSSSPGSYFNAYLKGRY